MNSISGVYRSVPRSTVPKSSAPKTSVSRSIDIIFGWPNIGRHISEWRGLVARQINPQFIHHPDWYAAFFQAKLIDPSELIAVMIRTRGVLNAVIPLRIQKRSFFGLPLRTLGLIHHPHMALSDIILDSGNQQCILAEAVDALHRMKSLEWDAIVFDNVTAESFAAAQLESNPHHLTLSAPNWRRAFVPTISEEAAFGPVSRTFKRNLKRLARRAEEIHPLSFSRIDDPFGLEKAVEEFFAVESSGWKGRKGSDTAIANNPSLLKFYRMVAASFGKRGQCVINLLRHGENVVAGQFCLSVSGRFNILKIGYDENCSWFAPGNLIMEQAIRDSCQRPDVQELSLVTDPPWGHFWKMKFEPVMSYKIFNPTARGRLLYNILRAKRFITDLRRKPSISMPAAEGADDILHSEESLPADSFA